MARKISDSLKELSDREKAKFLDVHIPYRLNLLRLGLVVGRASGLIDSAIVEAAIVTGRQLIEFLGFNIKYPEDKEGRPILVEDTKSWLR